MTSADREGWRGVEGHAEVLAASGGSTDPARPLALSFRGDDAGRHLCDQARRAYFVVGDDPHNRTAGIKPGRHPSRSTDHQLVK